MVLAIRQYEDIVNDIVSRLLSANTNLTDLNESSILRMLIESYSLELESEEFTGLYQKIRDVYESTRVSTAASTDLDEIGKLVGVTRKAGTKATSVVSFVRNTPTTSQFTILAGTVISTQPVGEEQTKRFNTLADAIFETSITDEVQTYIDGIYDYKLVQRLYDDVTSVKAIFSTIETFLVEDTDYSEVKAFSGKIIDVSTLVTLDACDVTTDWVASTDATAAALDATNKRQGTNSIKCAKSGSSEASAAYSKTYASGVDLSGKTPNLKIRIDDQTTLDKLLKIQIHLGDTSSNYLIFDILNANLSIGWNDIFLNTTTATSQGTPQLGDIKYINIDFITNAAIDTIPVDKLNFDFILFAEVEDYVGDIVRIIDTGTLPDNDTDLTISYVPLSLEINCEADEIGIDYNVAIGKLTYKVTSLVNITSVYNYHEIISGIDIETDSTFRERITVSTSSLGKATVDAIETAIAELSFVSSVNVDDMPTLNSDESNTYSTSTTDYQLDYEVAQQNTNLKLTTTKSTTNEELDDSETTITVVDGSIYSSSGFIIVDNEIIEYTGISTNDLTGCVRGSEGSTATTHTTATQAYQWFKPGTDFTISNESKVVWLLSGNEPDDAEDFDTYYEYRWLGHITVIATGPFTFSTAQNTSITDIIDSTKAAGIAYTYTTPTVISTNVNCSIAIKTGYSFSTIQILVSNAITTKLNSYLIDEDIYLSQLIDSIMNIDGVDYTTIASPSSTVTIASDEIAKAGTIIVNQI